ncbi:MAG: DUF6807 family protein [Opitutales bacterium]
MNPFTRSDDPAYIELRAENGELITGYRFDPEEYHPYCHPVNLPGEVPLTMTRPGDHPWHNGMAFCWKYLNGCNVWDQEASGPKPGACVHRGIELDEQYPRMLHRLDWVDNEGNTLLKETRTLEVVSLEKPFAHAYDWSFRFEATGEVVCEREPKHGGYAGFYVRFARGGANHLLNAEGEQDWPENWGGDDDHESRWCAFAFSLDGLPSRTWHGHFGGMAVFDHPDNPRHPTPWLTFNGIGMQKIMPAFIRRNPYTFQQGDTLELRYRAVSFSGKSDKEALDAEWTRWIANQ